MTRNRDWELIVESLFLKEENLYLHYSLNSLMLAEPDVTRNRDRELIVGVERNLLAWFGGCGSGRASKTFNVRCSGRGRFAYI